MPISPNVTLWSLLLRSLAAIVGGYVLAALVSILPLVLMTDHQEAVLWGTMGSFAVYTCAALWAFGARSAIRAWTGLTLLSAALLALDSTLWW
ncbi:MAG: DUF3649 domain-containing protein [Lautropia sp.]|nr:DUF3649 domain-containing protein [Lautropia sp.]